MQFKSNTVRIKQAQLKKKEKEKKERNPALGQFDATANIQAVVCPCSYEKGPCALQP